MRSEQSLRGEGVFDLNQSAACSGLLWTNFGFRRQKVGGQAAADPHLPTYRGPGGKAKGKQPNFRRAPNIDYGGVDGRKSN